MLLCCNSWLCSVLAQAHFTPSTTSTLTLRTHSCQQVGVESGSSFSLECTFYVFGKGHWLSGSQ